MLLQDTFSLGTWDKSTVTGEGEDLIRASEHGAQGEGGTIVLEVRGFECFEMALVFSCRGDYHSPALCT